MDIVIDTSALLAVIVAEPERDRIVKLTAGHTLIGPGSITWEIGNAFSAMLKRKKITPDQALKALEVYGKIRIRFLDVELEQSLKIADELGIYAYDAYIIRCAQKYRSSLVSLDQNLVACAKSMGIQVQEVC